MKNKEEICMDPRKDSVLKKDADIFKKRDENKYLGDKKKLSKEEKKAIFKEYYLKPIIIVLVIIAVIVYIRVDSLLHPTPDYKFEVACVGTYFSDDDLREASNKLTEFFGYDGEKEVALCSNYGMGDDYASNVKFQTSISAGEVDCCILDKYKFGANANNGLFIDLEEVLSKEQLEFFKDRLVYIDLDKRPSDEDRIQREVSPDINVIIGEKEAKKAKNKKLFGIMLEDEDKVFGHKADSAKDLIPVFSGINASHERDSILKFIQYFCDVEMGKK